MNTYSRTHLSDQSLLRDLAHHVAHERNATAVVVADIAEVDERKLYLPAGYSSMVAYCVGELGLSEDAAYKRIQAGRAARQFPVIFEALADGRLHLTAVNLLAPYLKAGNADKLLRSAAHKSKSAIEQLLAERFPEPEELPMIEVIPGPPSLSPTSPTEFNERELAPAQVEGRAPTDQLAPAQVGCPRATVAPIAARRYALHLPISQSMYDKLSYAQNLLSHQVRAGDIAEVINRALDVLIHKLENRKLGTTDKPRRPGQPASASRYVPTHVRHEVWKRDRGQCTFVSASGRRCEARTRLEFDHMREFARGGEATVENVRLRCRAHNQYTAECTFGVGFMRGQREEARRLAAEKRAAKAAAEKRAEAEKRARAAVKEKADEVIPYLRALGFRADQARQAAEHCLPIPEASLEERVKVALAQLAPSAAFHRRAAPV